MTHTLPVGRYKSPVTLCDRGHGTLPESVFYCSEGPFAPVGLSCPVSYTDAPIFPNASDANATPRHSSLRGTCSEGKL